MDGEPVTVRDYIDAQDRALRQHIDDLAQGNIGEIRAFREETALQSLQTQTELTELRGLIAQLGADVRKLLRDDAVQEGAQAAVAKRKADVAHQRERDAHRWSRAGIAVGIAGGIAALVKILLGQ